MRVRSLSAVAAAVLAATLLASCRTNVGVAAKVNGSDISESQVSSYITPSAQPVSLQGSSTPPKPFVLNVLIGEQFYRALLAKTPDGAPTQGQIDSMINTFLAGRTPKQAVEGFGIHGYTPAFAQKVLVYSELGNALNQDLQKGVDVRTIARNLDFPVSVNPRYGAWDPKTFSLSTAPNAGVPGFLSLQPTPTTGQPAG